MGQCRRQIGGTSRGSKRTLHTATGRGRRQRGALLRRCHLGSVPQSRLPLIILLSAESAHHSFFIALTFVFSFQIRADTSGRHFQTFDYLLFGQVALVCLAMPLALLRWVCLAPKRAQKRRSVGNALDKPLTGSIEAMNSEL